jgi:hypothetical protein
LKANNGENGCVIENLDYFQEFKEERKRIEEFTDVRSN